MKKELYSSLIAIMLIMNACQSVEQLSIDYMLPAEVSFPASLKRVAVVNNMPDSPENASQALLKEKEEKSESEIARQTNYYTGNASLTAQALAETLADGNYFDQVIICDSALHTKDRQPREATLSTTEVNELTRSLGADFLIAVENVQLRSVNKLSFLPDIQAYYGTVDVTVYTTLRIYLPNHPGPITTISSPDSIFWEEAGISEAEVRSRLIAKEDLIETASEFAGSSPVQYLLPHWKTAPRYLFTGGSVEMRDAAVYVREQNWEDAIRLWKQVYETKKGKRKMYAAYNIALGYEMQDSIHTAARWAAKAQHIAYDIDRVEEKTPQGLDGSNIPNYVFTTLYVNELTERDQSIARLNLQMQRFKDDF